MAEHILVTGGAGYIGSIVTAELLKKGYHVTVYDNLSHSKRQSVAVGADLVEGDVGDRAALDRLFTKLKIDAVMHFAAYIDVGESMRKPEMYFRNNTLNAFTLLEAMIAHKVQRFVFSSTAALFGNPEYTPIDEKHPLRPTSVYGESKLLVEHMLAWLNRIHGLRFAALRYFNAAGCTKELGEDHRPESHLIPLVLQVALGQRESVSIYGSDYPTKDGTCVRDFIHIVDLASAHLLAVEALKEHDHLIYNLGNGQGFTVREVIETARQVTGHSIPAREVERRPGDPAVLVASSEKIRRELGWKPKYPQLESIIRTGWEWMKRHPHGYEGER